MALRLNVIKSHFDFPTVENPLKSFRSSKINLKALETHYMAPGAAISNLFYSVTKDHELFDMHSTVEKPREELRELIIRQLLYLYPKFFSSFDMTNSITRANIGVILSGYDQALSTRYLVHSILYVETIEFLGTQKHQEFIEKGLKLQQYGSFSMTELGHGSNVASVETTATYDHSTREFILNSPTPTSTKWWIGALANTCNMSVVFAQLIVAGVSQGVHVFVIRVRDDNHNVVPGVIIGDCGAKASLAGIDNGFMMFRNYRVPYDSLLDRISQINEEGKYKSSIKSKEKRFGIMLTGLTGGRTGIIGSVELNMRNALTTAIRYGIVRRQFGDNGENPILTYPLHKYRLMPYLAKCFVSRICFKTIVLLYTECKDLIKTDPECMKVNEMHALISVFKNLTGRYSQDCIQECREACGGHGYSAYAGFMRIRENNDIHLTWDGDNNVLIQQCSRFLLKNIMHHLKGNPALSNYVSFFNAEKPKISTTTLSDPNTLISLLEFRTFYFMKEAMHKLQSNASSDPSSSWNKSQVHAMHSLTISFGELIAAKEFLKFCTALSSDSKETAEEVLNIFRLYVLKIAETDHFDLNDAEIKIVRNKCVEMCEEVSKVAVSVIDAIAQPDHIVGSVLGCSDGKVYPRYVREVEKAPKVYEKPSWVHLVSDMKKLIN